MLQPDLDEDGDFAGPSLQEFQRYIRHGMSCIVKLVVTEAGDNSKSFQFSMTLEQCREMATNLMICAQVIEHERATLPQ